MGSGWSSSIRSPRLRPRGSKSPKDSLCPESGGLVKAGRLTARLPLKPQPDELLDILFEARDLRVERIISTGQITEDWYDQTSDEFVLLVSGAARLLIEGETEGRRLEPGDWLLIPARCRHRVTWTKMSPPTVWLAIHYEASGGSSEGQP